MRNSITKSLARYRVRQENFTSYPEAIIRDRIAKYGWLRFRFSALSTFLSLAVHLIEFMILASVFTFNDFTALFFLRTIAVVFQSGWWGGLEVLRARVRVLYLARDLETIKKEIVCWMILAGVIAAIICILALILYWVGPQASMDAQVFKLYFFVILLQIALQMLVHTFHAGLYAVKRIPRPWLSVAITDIVAVIVVLFLPHHDRVYTLPLSLLLSSLLAAGMSVYYNLQAYIEAKFWPLKWWPDTSVFMSFLRRVCCTKFFLAGLASTVFSMDVIVINLLIMCNAALKDTYKIVIILYLLSPLVRSTANWTSLFYFDLKRKTVPALLLYRQALKKRLLLFAVSIGMIAWILSLTLIVWIKPSHPWIAAGLLLLLLLLISCVHYLQMEVFCAEGYVNVVVSGYITLAVFLLAVWTGMSLIALFGTIFICFILSFCWFRYAPCFFKSDSSWEPAIISDCEWLWKLHDSRVKCYAVKLNLSLPQAIKENLNLAKRIAVYIGHSGGVCYEKKSTVIYCFSQAALSQIWLAEHGYGLVSRSENVTLNNVADELKGLITASQTLEPDIHKTYQREINSGIIVFPGIYNPALSQISGDIVRQALLRAYAFLLKDQNIISECGYSVEAFYKDGFVRAVFLTDLTKNTVDQYSRWIASLRLANLEFNGSE